METTRLSKKGQAVVKKNVGDSRLCGPGMIFRETELDTVAGCLRSKGKPKTLAQMNDAIRRELMRRHDRGRY